MLDPTLYIHAANILFLCAYLVKSILWLRVLSVIAITCTIGFNYWRADAPVWEPIAWACLSITINLVQVGLLIKERAGIRFTEAEREMFETLFAGLNPLEYMKLLRAGAWEKAGEGEQLITRGSEMDRLVLLYNGSVSVDRGEGALLQLNDGAFLGEMAFVSGAPASADVKTETPAQLYVWTFESLRKLFDINPALAARFKGVLGRDLAEKLRG